jgi:hypothetical protein
VFLKIKGGRKAQQTPNSQNLEIIEECVPDYLRQVTLKIV